MPKSLKDILGGVLGSKPKSKPKPKPKSNPYQINLRGFGSEYTNTKEGFGLDVFDLTDTPGGLTAKQKYEAAAEPVPFDSDYQDYLKRIGVYDVVEKARLEWDKKFDESPKGKRLTAEIEARDKHDQAEWSRKFRRQDNPPQITARGIPAGLFTGEATEEGMRHFVSPFDAGKSPLRAKRHQKAFESVLKPKRSRTKKMKKLYGAVGEGVQSFGDYMKDQERVRSTGRTRRIRKTGYTAQ